MVRLGQIFYILSPIPPSQTTSKLILGEKAQWEEKPIDFPRQTKMGGRENVLKMFFFSGNDFFAIFFKKRLVEDSKKKRISYYYSLTCF